MLKKKISKEKKIFSICCLLHIFQKILSLLWARQLILISWPPAVHPICATDSLDGTFLERLVGCPPCPQLLINFNGIYKKYMARIVNAVLCHSLSLFWSLSLLLALSLCMVFVVVAKMRRSEWVREALPYQIVCFFQTLFKQPSDHR